jgi:ribosomal protein L11 methyltransferase
LKDYPAIDVRTSTPDLLLAIVDDFGPTAVEETEPGAAVRVFFPTATHRDAAQRALADRFDVAAVDVSDEDWARRSQENLKPITVGRLTVYPNPESIAASPGLREPQAALSTSKGESRIAKAIAIVIPPSMGFGTGHHATTRLCLAALQAIDLTDQNVLDVGTGSGVLALAADRLGAARAAGIDYDPDAIQSANENLALNPPVARVNFEVADLAHGSLPAAIGRGSEQVDVVTANLTGALLVRAAGTLLSAVRAGGMLILSGLQVHERDDVCRAFAPAVVVWERDEDGWVGLIMKKV